MSGDISMNSKSESEEASRGSEASSSKDSTPNAIDEQATTDLCSETITNNSVNIMKRAAAKQLIEKYFYQLMNGCGNPHCDNEFCASSGNMVKKFTPNEAAAEAIQLFRNEAPLCDSHPSKVPRKEAKPDADEELTDTTVSDKIDNKENMESPTTSSNSEEESTSKEQPHASHISSPEKASPQKSPKKSPKSDSPNNGSPLTEERLYDLCQECIKTKIREPLIRALGEAFTQPAVLARSFPIKRSENSSNGEKTSDKETKETETANDPDKDVDSVTGPDLDLDACVRGFKHLAKVPKHFYVSALVTSVQTLSENLDINIRLTKTMSLDDIIKCIIITFEVPDLAFSDYVESAVPALCRAIDSLPLKGKVKLIRVWSNEYKDRMYRIVEVLQQHITIRSVSVNYSRHYQMQDDSQITTATKILKMLYYANLLAGVMESNTLREDPIEISNQQDPLENVLGHLYPPSSLKNHKHSLNDDPIAIALGLNILDCREPLLPYEMFYNETINESIEMEVDFSNYRTDWTRDDKFAFLHYPFILTVPTKSMGLYYENRIRMFSERRVSLLHAVVGVAPPMPFLKLKVRRSHIIDDALVELEMIAMERALDLKKQLVVEFEGEQGVDEGGLSKEFFQLIVEAIFNADYGMFTQQPDSLTVWFNTTSFETEGQFTLIGIVLGLAIYNNIILPLNFPMVVYRKLMGKKGSFEDLADWNPTLYNGLKDMLEYTGDDLEAVYYQTFRIGYQDVFSNYVFHDLKEDGDSVFVTQENKREFVELYADYLLNKSVDTQFKAFRRGFLMVTDETPLSSLFRPEELELLVCGSKEFDFEELEMSTDYDCGYTKKTPIIRDFWSIVHRMSMDDKRRLLQFTTGSDRVPVGGFSNLKLVISRHGPDSDRLPIAHTCFNVLLLPEYSSKEKLQDRLMKAICYSQGFGML